MQEMIGGPSPAPTFFPSNQPAAVEAPPASNEIAAPDKTTLTVWGIVGIALAIVVVCAVVAVIVHHKCRTHSTPQQSSKAHTDEDAENPAELLAITNSSTTDVANEGDDAARESKILDDAFDRALHWFPNLLNGMNRSYYRTLQRLKKDLREKLRDILLHDPSLRERINGPRLFLKLGMGKKMVEDRFKALIDIEKELGIFGKSSFVDTVDLFVEYIEVRNPLGVVNDKIERMEENENFSHICVLMEKGKLLSAVKLVDSQLEGKGWGNLLMHGTKASVPKELLENPDSLQGSGSRPHDFGPGLYCFRGHVLAALSFAVDKCLLNENPCIIAFPQPAVDIEKEIINVNMEQIKRSKLKEQLPDLAYSHLSTRANDWQREEKNWRIAVALARWPILCSDPRSFYKNPKRQILQGWLHDVGTTTRTDEGETPRADSDGWIQYCVKTHKYVLGEKKLFIEFALRWDQWKPSEVPDNEEIETTELDRMKKDIDIELSDQWRNYMEERVQPRVHSPQT